jgi:PKD repeat protein
VRAGSGRRTFTVDTPVAVLLFLLVLVAPSDATGQARFISEPGSGPAPLTVHFTDQTFPPDAGLLGIEYLWTFGDGSTSTEISPTHVFGSPGEYLVSLSVTGTSPDSVLPVPNVATTTISVTRAPIDAAFTVRRIGDLTYGFTDTSTGPVAGWFWQFGDGATSTLQNPDHTYARPGPYTVELGVFGSGEEFPGAMDTQTIRIETPTTSPTSTTPTSIVTTTTRTTTVTTTVTTTPSQASFPPSLILSPTVLPQGFLVTVDGSATASPGTVITRTSWDWGDGVVEGHAVPHSHTYAASGSYTITVITFQNDGQSTTKSLPVYVTGPTGTITPPTTKPTTGALTVAPSTPFSTPRVTVTTVPATVTEVTVVPTGTEVTVVPTGTGGGDGDGYPLWLAAIVAVGLIGGSAAVAQHIRGRAPDRETPVPGVTIEARGGMRRPNSAGPPKRREAEVEIEVRGGSRRER